MATKKRDFNRVDRVAATLKRALAAPLGTLTSEFQLGLITVTRVQVSPDLRHADVFLSIYSNATPPKDVLKQLKEHTYELQRVVAAELRAKRTPVLRLQLDESIAANDRITRLLGGERDPDGVTE